jgi:hypothetical protein
VLLLTSKVRPDHNTTIKSIRRVQMKAICLPDVYMRSFMASWLVGVGRGLGPLTLPPADQERTIVLEKKVIF